MFGTSALGQSPFPGERKTLLIPLMRVSRVPCDRRLVWNVTCYIVWSPLPEAFRSWRRKWPSAWMRDRPDE